MLRGNPGAGKSNIANILTSAFKTKKVAQFSATALDYTDLENFEILYWSWDFYFLVSVAAWNFSMNNTNVDFAFSKVSFFANSGSSGGTLSLLRMLRSAAA